MHRPFLRYPCLLVLSLIAVLPAVAQSARISGQVMDPQNAVLSGAEVQVVNLGTKALTQTKADKFGNYMVPDLPAGRYQIEARAPGFSSARRDDIRLAAGQALVCNMRLKVAAQQASVSVEGTAAAAATVVETQSAEIGGIITGLEVSQLGLNGRDYTQLLRLIPGVSDQTYADEGRVGPLGSVSYSINGGRTEKNSFLLDDSETLNGGMNKNHIFLTVTPSIDAIQDVTVLTSNYGAMHSSTGSATIMVSTKSGTDKLHGNLYEFLRNEAFNSKGYFDIGNSAPLYRRNDFGGTIGGPVVVPHLYDGRNRTHFFFSEEARLEIDPYPFRDAVPSLAERNGNFNDVCPSGGSLPRQTTQLSDRNGNPRRRPDKSDLSIQSDRLPHSTALQPQSQFGRDLE